jgi:hypothetical protein
MHHPLFALLGADHTTQTRPGGIMDNAERLLGLLSQPYTSGPLGNIRQVAQPQVPCRSNSSWLGASLVELAFQAAGVGTAITGNTAGATVKNVFAGLYAGHGAAPAKLATVKAFTPAGEEVAKNKPLELTLEEALTITEAMAPHAYIYVDVGFESAGTAPKGIGVNCKTEAHVALAGLSAGSPLFLAAKAGTGLAAAPATIATPAAVEPVPMVILA